MNQVSIGSNNGLSPIWLQAIIWTNAELLSIGPLGTKFSEIQVKIQNFSFMKMHLKMLSVKQRPFCRGEDELKSEQYGHHFTGNIFKRRTICLKVLLVHCE